jgi:hypothetical protein
MAAAEHDIKCQAWLPAYHFEKLLEATCPNHTFPIKHKLKECTMMKNYMTTRTFARSKKPEGDLVGKVAALSSKRRQSRQFISDRPPTSHTVGSSSLPRRSTP